MRDSKNVSINVHDKMERLCLTRTKTIFWSESGHTIQRIPGLDTSHKGKGQWYASARVFYMIGTPLHVAL